MSQGIPQIVDLMASTEWSDDAITDRTEAMIASQFSAKRQLILMRMALGVAMGAYTLNPAEQAEMQAYMQAVGIAAAAAQKARADMALLAQVLAAEAGDTNAHTGLSETAEQLAAARLAQRQPHHQPAEGTAHD